MAIRIVRAEERHIPILAKTLRESDRLELYASMGQEPFTALQDSFEASVASWCIVVSGEPILIWGVASYGSLMGRVGMPWMLGSVAMDMHQLYIARKAPYYIGLMHRIYPELMNYVHAKNGRAVRFLEWCGFILSPTPLNIGGEIFYEARRSICVG